MAVWSFLRIFSGYFTIHSLKICIIISHNLLTDFQKLFTGQCSF